jgi:excisionase family DNA binding protein
MANRSPHTTLPRSAFSAQEVADRWGKTRQFIYNQINLGKLRSFKAGRSRLIPLSEIERIERGGTG